LPTFNQGFSAPIKLGYDYTPAQLATLVRVERDAFLRWDILQRLATGVLLQRFDDVEAAQIALGDALGDLLGDADADPAFVAECMQLPDFDTLVDMVEVIDIDDLLARHQRLQCDLASRHATRLQQRYHALADIAAQGLGGVAMSARRLRNACLAWLSRIDPQASLASAQFAAATRMTDRLAALREDWSEIAAGTGVRDTAKRLLRVHALRAADALQLAAASVLADGDPGSVTVVSLDDRLRDAARREGFQLLPRRTH